MWGLTVKVESMPNSTVWPSGGALATLSAPMLPLAPALFSTTKGWLNCFCSTSAMERAMVSEGPPAGKLLTNFTGFVGHAGACPKDDAARAISARATRRFMESPSGLVARLLHDRRPLGAVGHQHGLGLGLGRHHGR